MPKLNTKIQLDSFTELKRRLDGKCGNYCPINIIRTIKFFYVPQRTQELYCACCVKYWQWIAEDAFSKCPCGHSIKTTHTKESIFIILDEVIDTLTSKLNKEYSL